MSPSTNLITEFKARNVRKTMAIYFSSALTEMEELRSRKMKLRARVEEEERTQQSMQR